MARLVCATKSLDSPEEHFAKSVRAELILSAGIVLFVASHTVYLARE
jgi:hypothetical protein